MSFCITMLNMWLLFCVSSDESPRLSVEVESYEGGAYDSDVKSRHYAHAFLERTMLSMIVARHTHRRSSSKWVPPSAPLHNPISIFRNRATRIKGSRMIQPNHLFDEPRYDLGNFRQFTDNSITTTKYSLLTFIPYNIVHQMCTKYANIYFLFIAALNFCPLFAAYTRFLGLVPISFVLGTTIIKDGFEDFRRWRYDNQINGKTCHVWDRDHQMFRKMQWKHLLVGDFVHISNDQDIPADVLFLRSSDESATCYVETCNLDGETSLKQRLVPRQYVSFSQPDANFTPPQFTGTVFCEPPDPAIYTIRAKIEYEPGRFEVISKDNMLLRGSRLRNTTFVEGIVLYAGHDTKVMMNNGRAPHKISGIEQLTNKFIIVCVLILITMVFLSSTMSGFWAKVHPIPSKSNSSAVPDPFVVWNSPTPVLEGLYNVGTFIICYQIIVPISLYITVEIIKAAQIYFLSQDIELYDEKSDRPIDCRSLNIPEELGQITHILSDKTGTLTENIMVFRSCAFDSKDYGSEMDQKDLDPNQPVASAALIARINAQWRSNSTLKHFFLNIVLNNSVVVNKTPHHDEIEVGNSSFYDVTLEQFNEMVAKVKNHPVTQSRPDSLSDNLSRIPEDFELTPISPGWSKSPTPVSMCSEKELSSPTTPSPTPVPKLSSTSVSRVSSLSKFFRRNIISPITDLIPYDSIRKRHETLMLEKEEFYPFEAESPDELALILGAKLYNFVLEDKSATHIRIGLPDSSKEKISVLQFLPFHSERKRMSVVIDTPAGPLLYCKGADSAILPRLRQPTEAESVHCAALKERLDDYSCKGLRTLAFAMRLLKQEEWNEFMDSYRFVMSLSSNDRDELLSQKADEIEKDLELLGVTGIEDRLQDGVEETLVALRGAGIQVWVLTGDKLETAENIARSCGLFSSHRETRKIETREDLFQNLGEGFNLILSPQATTMAKRGDSELLSVLRKAKAVLCYRMTPSEKAEIVKCVKTHLKGKVLAIGDGANDVPMIQAAHVGVGVAGKEGMQAAMACDFAIARFRFLRRLLLVHGHWCYDRLALIFLYFLYKNTNNVFILFFFQIYNGWSASFTMDPTYTILYPIIFSALQPIMVGVIDQDRSAEELLEDPSLYSPGRKGTKYTHGLFALSVIDGIWQAAVVYFVAHLTFAGEDSFLWGFGFHLSTGTMLTNAAHLSIELRCWTVPTALVFIFFVGLHFVYFIFYSIIVQPTWTFDPPVLAPIEAMITFDFWLVITVTTVIALLPRFATRCLWNTLFNEYEHKKTK